MKKKVVFLPYDMDTAIGINNEGALVFSYNLEDIDHLEGGADVFNGQNSVLWQNLRACFGEELKAMYQGLRSTGALSYDKIEKAFEDHQGKWPEAIFNEDAWFKYLQPLVDDGSGAYLAMLQGSKAEQRKWWLYNRFRYLDSKYNAGDALSDVIQLRGYAKADITVVPYADVYPSIKYGSYLVQKRGARKEATTLECPLDNVNDTEIYIYSASQLASVGDLSGLLVGYADFSFATKLQQLKLGDKSGSYSNSNLTELYLGNNVLLRTLDIRNCPKLTQAVDISGCVNVEEVYFDGTSITGLILPNGGILKVLHVPETLTNLTIRNQSAIREFQIPSYRNISTLRLENVSSVIDSKAILKAIPVGSRVRIIGFDWQVENATELLSLLDILDTMRGLDEGGNNMATAQVSGTIHIDTITGAEFAEVKERYPNIKIAYKNITSILYYYNYDGSSLLYQETIKNCGNGTYTSRPSRSATAQYSYSFIGWNLMPDSQSVDTNALKNVDSDRKVYAAYSRTIRKYTVRFYNGTTLLQTINNVDYGSSATYTGTTPVSSEGSVEDFPFIGWNPEPRNITGDTNCYAQYKSPVVIKEINDSWAGVFASLDDGTYKEKYNIGNYKEIDLGVMGKIQFQIAAFNADELADGSGYAPITWVAIQLLAKTNQMNPTSDNVAGGRWDTCAMRNYLSEVVMPCFPENIRNRIAPVTKYTHMSHSGTGCGTETTIDSLWLPSSREMVGSAESYHVEDNGPKYTILYKDDASRKKAKVNGYSSISWWLRSYSLYDNSASFSQIREGGNIHNWGPTDTSVGICLGFCTK